MASSNVSTLDRLIARSRRVANRLADWLDPVLAPLGRGARFVKGSFFRFMIFLGVVFLLLGATAYDGVVAGHLGIYGATSIFIGIVGRLIVHWKVQQA